jgi:hypothetical protein
VLLGEQQGGLTGTLPVSDWERVRVVVFGVPVFRRNAYDSLACE